MAAVHAHCGDSRAYPRVSYLDLLPPLFRRDLKAASFSSVSCRCLRVLKGVEDRYDEFSRQLNPEAVRVR